MRIGAKEFIMIMLVKLRMRSNLQMPRWVKLVWRRANRRL